VLANIHPQIFEVFKITRLNKLFNIRGTTDEALREFT
jgi:anti-anti-sigma regulatory factor